MKLAATGFVLGRLAAWLLPMHCSCASSRCEDMRSTSIPKPLSSIRRPAVGNLQGFRFFDTTNSGPDQLRRRVSRVPVAGFLAGRYDAATYNRLFVREMAHHHASENYDLSLWLGEFARGRMGAVPVVSYIQGPPGTDARSILNRSDEIKALAGPIVAFKWDVLARLRLSRVGLPPLRLLISSSSAVESREELCVSSMACRMNASSPLPYPDRSADV